MLFENHLLTLELEISRRRARHSWLLLVVAAPALSPFSTLLAVVLSSCLDSTYSELGTLSAGLLSSAFSLCCSPSPFCSFLALGDLDLDLSADFLAPPLLFFEALLLLRFFSSDSLPPLLGLLSLLLLRLRLSLLTLLLSGVSLLSLRLFLSRWLLLFLLPLLLEELLLE